MRARDLMTRSPIVVAAAAPVQRAAALMEEWDVGFLPVVDDLRERRLVGVLTDRDIAIRCVAHHYTPGRCVEVFMTAAPVTSVGAEATPKQILRTMEMAELRRVPVVDAEGRVVGVISREDLTRRFDVRAPGAVETLVERLAMPAD